MSAASDPVGGILILLIYAVVIGSMIYVIMRHLYQRYRLWHYIAEDEEQADPLQILYLYKAEEVENQQ